jgi:tumor protein p53-inducible protein 3
MFRSVPLLLAFLAVVRGTILPKTMDAIVVKDGRCVVQSMPVPYPGPKQVLVRVMATALNRADTLQRRGKHPPPQGVTDVLGLELAGTVVEIGSEVKGDLFVELTKTTIVIGSRVMALVAGGGYAEYALVDEGSLMPIPSKMSFVEAAAIPEVHLTAYQLLHFVAQVPEPKFSNFTKQNRTVLIHAAGSGVGIAAIQLAKAAGYTVLGTAGTIPKLATAGKLGADGAFNYKNKDGFVGSVKRFTNGKGVDLILDCVGGTHAVQNYESLGMDSKWVVYGLMGGADPNLPNLFSLLLRKRASILTSTLRTRSKEYKASLVKSFIKSSFHLNDRKMLRVGRTSLKVNIDKVYKHLHDAQAAHEYMESNANNGKIVIQVREEGNNTTMPARGELR